jgi:uncharacterized protein (DUF305 family)
MPKRFLSGCVLAALLVMPFAADATESSPAVAEKKAVMPAASVVSPHQGHAVAATPTDSASTIGFKDANAKMHEGMAIAFSGDADVDFVRGMIPHHQGAIDMARVLLAHGKDPELQKLGNDIIAAQTKEIAQMEAWLAIHVKPTPITLP